ncbi:hypothetical protein AB8881_08600 [Alphaproteobacteria bacterium LSUCC0396]
MDRIFIPTVNRVDRQITYNGLPKSLQKKVTMVVQHWERPQYKYDCDYLVLPKKLDLSDPMCLPKSREIIYREGRNIKYSVIDDDLIFKRRNQKRFGLPSDMEKSSRLCTNKDVTEMFKTFSKWLDDPTVTFCGPSQIQNIPSTDFYKNNQSISSFVCFNGSDFKDVLDDLPTTEVRYGEDTIFFLSLLSRGFGNRVSHLFCFGNESLKGKIPSDVWDKTKYNDVWRDHKKIEKMFPQFFKIPLDENGKRIEGGFRNFGKVRTYWSKCYQSSQFKSQKSGKKMSYRFRGHNRINLNDDLENEIKQRFDDDRENRFQLFLLSSSIRKKYLDKTTNQYTKEFQKWYSDKKLTDYYGSLSNFTKYCGCGEVVNYVGTKTSDPQKYLKQLPLSVGSLYELSMVLKSDKDLFNILLHYTPKRKSVDEPKFDWITKRPPLIRSNQTEKGVRDWRQKWENPPPPKPKRTDKRTLKFLTITVNGELFDFDKKNGDKIGCVDLNDVENFLTKVRKLITKENEHQFLITDEMEYLTDGYFKRKDQTDVTKNLKGGKKDTTKKYK